MRIICKFTAFLLLTALLCGAASCSREQPAKKADTAAVNATAAVKREEPPTPDPTAKAAVSPSVVHRSGRKTLVAYFSLADETERIARRIADITSGDLYEIMPLRAYRAEDVEWANGDCRAVIEQNDEKARPAIAGNRISLEEYGVIYVGYPLWLDRAPRILCTFAEAYDFGSRAVIPFCVSDAGTVEASAEALSQLAQSGRWLSGTSFPPAASDDSIRHFINGNNL